MRAKSASRRWCTHCSTWRARNGFSPSVCEERGQAGGVQAEKVGLHVSARTPRTPGRNTRSRCAPFPAPSEPCTALASIESAKSARMVPLAAFFGSVAPISSRFFAIAFSPSQHLHQHRAGNHEIDQVLEERALAVHRVEAFGLARATGASCARRRSSARRLSKRARIWPIAFFFTASGLMMERVRSTAIPGSPWMLEKVSPGF